MIHHLTALILCPLVLFAASGCDRGARDSDDARQSIGFRLDPEYPAEFQAGDHVLSGRVIARGDSLYHRVVGGANCIMCHGTVLEGGSLGTNLRDGNWHHGDGSYPFIVAVSLEGVEEAVASPISRMPPSGGFLLSGPEIEAISAYIYWIAATRPWPSHLIDAEHAPGQNDGTDDDNLANGEAS